jgi:hypothetical protein
VDCAGTWHATFEPHGAGKGPAAKRAIWDRTDKLIEQAVAT